MLYAIAQIFIVFAFLLIGMPVLYADTNMMPGDTGVFTVLPQQNFILFDVDSEQIFLEKMPSEVPNLRSEYLFTKDLGGVPQDDKYFLYMPQDSNYFSPERRNLVFGEKPVINAIWEDEDKYLNDKVVLRKRWKEFFGVDIFYLYFKAKELEDWVKDYFSAHLFGMKGRPQFRKDKMLYVFKRTF